MGYMKIKKDGDKKKKMRNRPKKSILYGKNSIAERIKTNPKSIKKIYIQDNFKDDELFNIVKRSKLPLQKVNERELEKIKKADRLQGIIAEVNSFEYSFEKEILESCKNEKISIVCLDNINDPHNLGSILRITACLGRIAIVIAKHNSCHVNDTVMHVASGGENYVKVVMVDNMSRFLLDAKKQEIWVVGTVVDDSAQDLNKLQLPFPLCVVLGSEGKGIRHGVDKQLDMKVMIPMKGANLSFNLAMAAAIFSHEITKQRPV